MEMKTYLQVIIDGSHFDAGYKARKDVDTCLANYGYRPCMLNKSRQSWQNNLYAPYRLHKLASALKDSEALFLQYPYYLFSSKWKNMLFFKSLLSHYKGEVECLIHDIHGMRDGRGMDKGLGDILNRCSKVIVHTPAMGDLLVRQTGLDKSKIRVLYLFDYLTEAPLASPDPSGKTIVFAGNLSKSEFVKQLYKLPHQISFNLYGNVSPNVLEADNCHYKGTFQPEDVGSIEGNWGLVWDGDSIETCHGPLGDYLRINSSHKTSLYLAACKPVIVWEQSSLKDFIINNHLGIAVQSLFQIPERISRLTSGEIEQLKSGVEQFSKRLRSGYFLKECLK